MMKVRVRLHPRGDWWIVEYRKWFEWIYAESFNGDYAKDKALAYAHRLSKPEII